MTKNVLFVGKCSTYTTATSILEKTKKNPGFQIIKFINLLLEGLRYHKTNISVISNIDTSSTAINNETENEIKYKYIPTIHIPLICQATYYICAFFNTLKWGIKHRKNRIIICDICSSNSTTSGCILAAKILKIPACAIITDMLSTPITTSINTTNFFWKLFLKLRKYKQYRSLLSYDGFIFLTKYMNEVYNPKDKPYIVMEGSIDHSFIPNNTICKRDPKVILYAGAIEKEYGFNELVKAFMSLPTQNIELHVYGNGKFVNKLLEYQKIDSRVKYMGVVSNEQIVEEEQRATLLVNPRLSHEEFVKYSCPSKTSEYMLSGTPLVTTKLCGIPDEYFQYVYTFEQETIEGFAKTLIKILSIPEEELIIKGKEAQDFVLKNKNNIIQAQRIKDFLDLIY